MQFSQPYVPASPLDELFIMKKENHTHFEIFFFKKNHKQIYFLEGGKPIFSIFHFKIFIKRVILKKMHIQIGSMMQKTDFEYILQFSRY